MECQLQIILTACIGVNFGLTSVQQHNQVVEQFQNLFDSIAKNNAKDSKFYNGILRQEVAKERLVFDAMKEELVDAQSRIADRKKNFYKNSNFNDNVVANKREVNENNDDAGPSSVGFVPITPETAGPSTPFDDTTVAPRTDIFVAARWNDLESIKRLVEEVGVPVNTTNSLKQTVAHVVVSRFNSVPALDFLLDRDPSLVFMKDKWGQTILHVAIRHGCTDLMEYLVDKRNASIYQPIDGRFGQSAIHLAAEECRMSIMIYFVEEKKCDVNVRNMLGETPVFSAASHNHLNMIQYLMSKGADIHLFDKNDENILYGVAKRGDLTIPKYLLGDQKIKFDMDWRNNQGETLLHTAVKYRQLNFVKYLVEETNIDKDMFDNLDRTALYIATEMGNLEIVRYLVEHGANYKLDDHQGRTPAEIATDARVREYLSGLNQKKCDRRNVHSPHIPTFKDR